jgi:hypothetical protein
MKYEVIRDVTVSECHWLKDDVKKGTVVYEYNGYTYGCVSPGGVACTLQKGQTPFFELPYDSIKGLEQ